jgi:endo-1,4-beta-xylanase
VLFRSKNSKNNLVIFGILTVSIHTQNVLYDNKTGQIDGYSYELWKDTGQTQMTLLGGGKFSCQWSSINNALFRIGKKWDCTKTWQQLGAITVAYNVDYRPNGNSYMCVYGWTRNPLIEYYIVDSWGSWRPPGAPSSGTINVDGGTYDIYTTDRINQPSIDGTATFKQFWSVRQQKKTQGVISVNKHFEAWTQKGMRLGLMYEASLTIEGYQSSGSATVNQNDITGG